MKLLAFSLGLCLCVSCFAQQSSAGLSPNSSDSAAPRHRWSVAAAWQWNSSVSSSMRESITSFRSELQQSYTNSGYPFRADEVSQADGWSAMLGYDLDDTRSAVFVRYEQSTFITRAKALVKNAAATPMDEARMNIHSICAGWEHTLLPHTASFNAFGRLSVAASFIGGYTSVTTPVFNDATFHTTTTVPNVGRLGFAAEVGVSALVPSTRFSIEFSAGYFMANALGRAYTAPSSQPSDNLYERQLNDAANPNNASDHARTIDLLALRAAVRCRL